MDRAALLLARRNLARDRARLGLSVGGVALAFSLTLALDAIYAGVANQLTAYVNRAGADVWVSQAGVHNLHMVASWLPEEVIDQVAVVEGVVETTPILYSTDTVVTGGERSIAYVIGLPYAASMGRPWRVAEGSDRVGRGEVILDRGLARRTGLALGDRVGLLGGEATIVGLSEGTASLLNSVAFVSFEDFRSMRSLGPLVSYVLVRSDRGISGERVAAAIEDAVPGVSAQSREAFAAEERRLLMDMSADVITVMNIIGCLVGLAVVALSVYVATLTRRREYGLLRALGMRDARLYRVVAAQAAASVAAGLAMGLLVTALLGWLVGWLDLGLELTITAESVVRLTSLGALIALIAAILPIRQVAGLDPALVFRRGVAP